jgi:hypothetical protein
VPFEREALTGYIAGEHFTNIALRSMQDTLYLSSISRIFWRSSSNNSSSGKKDLVSVFGVSSSLDDNIGMVFEEGDYLLRCGKALVFENSPLGLIDDSTEDAHCPLKLSCQFTTREGVGKGMTLIGDKSRDCCHGIPVYQTGVVQKVLVGTLSYRILAGIEDCHEPLLHHPPVIAEPIRRSRSKLFTLCEPTGDDTDAVREKSRVRRLSDLCGCGTVRYENTRRVACNLLLQRWDGSSVS